MSNREWLLNKDFAEYRKEEIKRGALFFKNILTSPHDSQYIRGVSDALKAIIKIPKDIAQTTEEKETAEILVEAGLKQVEVEVYRSILTEE